MDFLRGVKTIVTDSHFLVPFFVLIAGDRPPGRPALICRNIGDTRRYLWQVQFPR